MEKYLNPYDKENMRIAMLKHEETFKQQVYELHRLYRVQKILMQNIESNRPNPPNQEAKWRLENGFSFKQHISQGQDHRIQEKSTVKLDLEGRPPCEENFMEPSSTDHHRVSTDLIDESEIELTLGLGPASYSRTSTNKKPDTPLTSDSGPSFSSSSTGSSHINRTSSLPKQTGDKATEDAGGRETPAARLPDTSVGYQSGSKRSIDVEEQQQQLRQERLKHPSWLFQVLSLNMT